MKDQTRKKQGYFSLTLLLYFFLVLFLSIFNGCSINRIATRATADALSSTGGGTTFTGDSDPELVRDALPFALKMFEGLLEVEPKHKGLLETTASGFIAYANAFVHTPADMLDDTRFREKQKMYKRAANLYLRGRDYALQGLELRHPNFLDELRSGKYEEALAQTDKKDLPFLYWAAAGWLGAVSVDSFNLELLTTVSIPVAMLVRILEIDDTFDDGGVHDIFISLYGAIPHGMLFRSNIQFQEDRVRIFLNSYYKEHAELLEIDVPENSRQKARFHLEKAVAYSNGNRASPYVAFASSVSHQQQDSKEFKALLNKALGIDIDKNPAFRLINILQQQKAKWMLDNIEDFFLVIE